MTMRGACCAGTTANSARDRTANFATDIICHRTWGRRSWQAPLPDGRGSDWSRDRSIRAVTVSTYMVEFCNFLAEYFRGHRPRPMLARLPLHSEIGANFRGNSPGVSPRLSADSALSAVDFPSSSSAFSPRLRVSASNSHPVWFRLRRVRERSSSHEPVLPRHRQRGRRGRILVAELARHQVLLRVHDLLPRDRLSGVRRFARYDAGQRALGNRHRLVHVRPAPLYAVHHVDVLLHIRADAFGSQVDPGAAALGADDDVAHVAERAAGILPAIAVQVNAVGE